VVRARGFENVTVDQLVAELAQRGRETVPDSVKAELLLSIRAALRK